MIPEPNWSCAECGFEAESLSRAEMPETVRAFARRYRIPLTRGLPGEDLDALLRTRPADGGWSALEYACHARDVFLVTDYRVGKVLEKDRPQFRRIDPDTGAADGAYNTQDPTTVVTEIETTTEALGGRLEQLAPVDWARVGIRDDEELSVDLLARNAVHEGAHHLLDIGRALRTARGR